MRTPGYLHPLPIPVWKWEDISMDFVVGLPRTSKGYDSIWVIVDCLTKSAHFILVDTRYAARKYAQIYFDQVVTLHGVLLTIIYDRGSVFCLLFLGATTVMSWYSSPQKLSLSSTNWWPNEKGELGT